MIYFMVALSTEVDLGSHDDIIWVLIFSSTLIGQLQLSSIVSFKQTSLINTVLSRIKTNGIHHFVCATIGLFSKLSVRGIMPWWWRHTPSKWFSRSALHVSVLCHSVTTHSLYILCDLITCLLTKPLVIRVHYSSSSKSTNHVSTLR